jgi:hypothetical protein
VLIWKEGGVGFHTDAHTHNHTNTPMLILTHTLQMRNVYDVRRRMEDGGEWVNWDVLVSAARLAHSSFM